MIYFVACGGKFSRDLLDSRLLVGINNGTLFHTLCGAIAFGGVNESVSFFIRRRENAILVMLTNR